MMMYPKRRGLKTVPNHHCCAAERDSANDSAERRKDPRLDRSMRAAPLPSYTEAAGSSWHRPAVPRILTERRASRETAFDLEKAFVVGSTGRTVQSSWSQLAESLRGRRLHWRGCRTKKQRT